MPKSVSARAELRVRENQRNQRGGYRRGRPVCAGSRVNRDTPTHVEERAGGGADSRALPFAGVRVHGADCTKKGGAARVTEASAVGSCRL